MVPQRNERPDAVRKWQVGLARVASVARQFGRFPHPLLVLAATLSAFGRAILLEGVR